MLRVDTVVTGVAGAPYYLNGYFDFAGGSAVDACQAWHTFITGGIGASATGFPVGATVTTSPTVPVVDPVSGDVLGIAAGDSIISDGVNTTNLLPPANQILMRWRTGIYFAGREVRGRTNLPCPLEEGSTDDGQVESAVVAALNVRGNALIADTDSTHVIWSRKYGFWQETAVADCWSQFSILRSRRD